VAQISLFCTNPDCKRPIAFDAVQANTVQPCPHCGQQLFVPAPPASHAAVQAVPPAPMAHTPMVAQPVQYAFSQHERSQEAQITRRLRMGSGCFAMLAVMFAVGLMSAGFISALGIDDQRLWGLATMVGGIAGLAAFVYFGYVAQETDAKSSDKGRR
jgi:hypothetical protein